jgi:hypothetical protein
MLRMEWQSGLILHSDKKTKIVDIKYIPLNKCIILKIGRLNDYEDHSIVHYC